jgi:predicted TPR repeat methyltransferase
VADDYLRRVYDLENQGDTDAYYSEWAATYDDELTRNGYRTPDRCAAALARFVAAEDPLLDVGCGTGLSGAALARAGFTDITGQDLNADMLAKAQGAGIYRETRLTTVDEPFPFPAGTYAALAAIGVIGIGAAPASLLSAALDALDPGGYLVFSYNDHALAQDEFTGALDHALSTGAAERVFEENGPHFEALGTRSTVYVLRRPEPATG